MIRKFSTLLLVAAFAVACTSADDPNRRTKTGAGVGAATGAVVGAVIGNQSGNNRTGAVVGAAAGAAIGAAVGRRMDQQQKELEQIQGVEVTRTAENEIQVQVTNDILFDFNSTALRAESRSTLRDLAANIQRYPDETVTVEGHTDNVGSSTFNQTLSENRANSVRSYLIEQGLASSRISAYGYGETRPKSTNSTPEGRQLNRRVEIKIRATQS